MANAYGFSEGDAKRIGKAVRVVERLGPLSERSGPQSPEFSRGVRLLLGKVDGSNGWAVNSSAVVTVHNGSPGSVASAVTIVAHNQFLRFSTGTQCTQQWVALGHNGYGWYAVAREPDCSASTCSMTFAGIDFSLAANYQASKIQLLGHNSAGTATDSTVCVSLRWYDITTCSTAA